MANKIIDPYGSELVEDYEKIIKDFGLEHFNVDLFPNANRIMRRGVVFAGSFLLFCHRQATTVSYQVSIDQVNSFLTYLLQ